MTELDLASSVLVHRISEREAVVFGSAEALDLVGRPERSVPSAFLSAMRRTAVAAPLLQTAVDTWSGRVVRLTGEALKLARENESLRSGVLTGVLRDPSTKKLAGMLTFVDPKSAAGLLANAPAAIGAAALQAQLKRIEKALDDIKADLDLLLVHIETEAEAGIGANLHILSEAYRASSDADGLPDDQWDRIVNIEQSVRSLHILTRRKLLSLTNALEGHDRSLPHRVKALNKALRSENSAFWLRAHVHAEIALARWDALYLIRVATEQPDILEETARRIRADLERRQDDLRLICDSLGAYLSLGVRRTSPLDVIRLISRSRLRKLLLELDTVQATFARNAPQALTGRSTPIALGDGGPERSEWRHLVTQLQSLPAATLGGVTDLAARIPALPRRNGD